MFSARLFSYTDGLARSAPHRRDLHGSRYPRAACCLQVRGPFVLPTIQLST